MCDECSRLIKSFSEKVKAGSRSGLQFKIAKKPDYLGDFIKEELPDLYKRAYNEN